MSSSNVANNDNATLLVLAGFFQLVPEDPGKKCFDLISSSSKYLSRS